MGVFFRGGAETIVKLVDKIISDRRQGHSNSMSDGPDLLDLLLLAVDNEGESFTDQEIKEHALTFVLAGSETTGNLMVWIFYILMTHDHVLKACQQEIDQVIPNNIDELTNEHLSKLVICEAIINETLRLYPSAPIFIRRCIHGHTIVHLFAYLPFAAGPRNCIGQNFALLEAKIILAMFVQHCHFKLVTGQKIIPEVKITLRTKYGLSANTTKRQI
ncbi:unnamed protein product [Adineta steineri]|uniref:Cytochrome P450 n=1 Tax=Adineta steineri TaxID=433720 RepID=A0A813X022_9BILA|nr:unnamed protein product [Adineta steineri]